MLRCVQSLVKGQVQTHVIQRLFPTVQYASSQNTYPPHSSGLAGFYCLRCLSSKKEPKKKKLKISSSAPVARNSDIYGPPDPVSNIQTVSFYKPPDETQTEKMFRLRRTEVLEWNHKFWADHNTKFFKEKAEFVKLLEPSIKVSGKKSTPAEQMSVFYRKFLNENRQEHLRYNKEWYKKNISLLWPAFLVFFIRLRRRLQAFRIKS